MLIQAVILDCDGVVVDSERLSSQAMAEAMTQAGYPITHEQCIQRFAGATEEHIVDSLEQPPEQAQQMVKDYNQRLEQLFEQQLQPVPGALEFIEYLSKQGIPFALASNSHRARLLTTLAHTGALAWFDGRFFGRDDVACAKPEPDLYLKASAFLQIAPKHCLVIEDSLTGANAGLKAGCRVWALVRSGSGRGHLELGCERVFSDYNSLQQALSTQVHSVLTKGSAAPS